MMKMFLMVVLSFLFTNSAFADSWLNLGGNGKLIDVQTYDHGAAYGGAEVYIKVQWGSGSTREFYSNIGDFSSPEAFKMYVQTVLFLKATDTPIKRIFHKNYDYALGFWY